MENNKDFITVLNYRVDDYFKSSNTTKFGNIELYFKGILFISLYVASFLCLLLVQVNEWVLWLLYMFMGLMHVLIALNIAHDGIHSSYSEKKWLNHLAFLSFNLVGGNSYIFRKRHLITHIETDDADKRSSINKQKFLMQYKQKDKAKNLPVIFYLFFSFYMLLIRDFILFKQEKSKIPTKEYLVLFCSKILYFGLIWILPFFIIGNPVWQIFVGLFLMNLVTTISYVVILIMPTEGIEQPKIGSFKDAANDWAVEVLRYNVDFSPHNRLINWVFGGANMNVIHYLFPDISHVHYVKLANLVKETVEETGLIYREDAFYKVFGMPFKYFQQLKEKDRVTT